MGTFDSILADAGNEFGLSNSKAATVLSGLLSMMNDSPGGFRAFLDRLCKAGLNDFVSSWVRGISPRPISSNTLETAIGRGSVERIAARAGLSISAASSVLAYLLPAIVQRLTPGGVIPSYLPSDVLFSYGLNPTAAVVASARHAAYATERAVKRVGAPPGLWTVIFFVVIALLGFWYWSSHRHARASSTDDQHSVLLGAPSDAAASLLAVCSA